MAVLVALQLPAAGGAGAPSPSERAQQLRSENAALAGQADAAWLSSVSLSTRLDQTRAALVRFHARTLLASACLEETAPGEACSGEAAARAAMETTKNVSACLRKPEDMRFPATTGAPEGGRYVTSTAP